MSDKEVKQRTKRRGGLSTRKKLVFAASMSVVTFLVFFTLAELYTRIARPHRDLLAMTGRRTGASPMAEWAYVDAFCAYRGQPGRYSTGKTVNRHGFISTPEIEYEKAEGEIRIVFLGGSSTAGTGKNLPDSQTWPWKSTEMLRARDGAKRISFLNAAIGGYTSFESYGRLWSRIRFFQPDIVVVYHGWNELYYFDDSTKVRTWRADSHGQWGLGNTNLKVIEPMALDHVLQYSQLLTRVRRDFGSGGAGELGARRDSLSKEFDHQALQVWRSNLQLIRDACRNMDAELFVCKQATLIVPGLSEKERKRCAVALHGFDHDAHVRAFEALYRVIGDEIPEANVIDMTPLSGVPEYFHDHVHPTREGTTEIAEIVSSALTESVFR